MSTAPSLVLADDSALLREGLAGMQNTARKVVYAHE